MLRWLSGLAAGALGAISASLVSLPLKSPDDLLFNTATVTVGALAVGVGHGILWQWVGQRRSRWFLYTAVSAGGFAVVAAVALAGETVLSDTAAFVIPLAAIVFAVTALLSPAFSTWSLSPPWPAAATGAAAVAALAVGLGLSGFGDAESGRLSLPEPAPSAGQGEVVRAEVEGLTFNVVPGESVLTYTVREKLASLPTSSEAVGRTTQISGVVYLDGRPSAISADLSTLASNQQRRDNYVRNNIFQTDPIVQFEVDALPELPDGYLPGETVTRSVSGAATVRGVRRPLTFEVEARLDGDALQIVGRTDFTWADFNIPPPNIGGIVQVEDNVHIEVLIVAKADSGSSPQGG